MSELLTYKPKILLFKGKGFVSKAIQWQTRSPFSHAAILMPDGRIIESWQGRGVRIKNLRSWENIHSFSVRNATPEQWEAAISFCKIQVGAKYDYKSVLQFVTRRKQSASGQEKWFCSELVFAAFQHTGVDLLSRVEPSNVSPGDLGISPMLTDETKY